MLHLKNNNLKSTSVTDSSVVGTVCTYVCMVITHSKGKDRPGKVANPARGQLNRKNEYFPVPVRA